ncbi:type I-E CRISPR-associated endoribonuclease Cas2 [Streptomyces sp. NPDC001091]
MIVIAAPDGLRGHLTRWMVEASAGVFVGNPSRRLRDRRWALLMRWSRTRRAGMAPSRARLPAPGRAAGPRKARDGAVRPEPSCCPACVPRYGPLGGGLLAVRR